MSVGFEFGGCEDGYLVGGAEFLLEPPSEAIPVRRIQAADQTLQLSGIEFPSDHADTESTLPGGASIKPTGTRGCKAGSHEQHSKQQNSRFPHGIRRPQFGDHGTRNCSFLITLGHLHALLRLSVGSVSNYAMFRQARSMAAPVKVEIFGQTYSIQGELEPAYVHKLAKLVDEKMHAIAAATGTIDTQKVAVLAALAIADELQTLQFQRGEDTELLREQAERCLTLVERALKQTA